MGSHYLRRYRFPPFRGWADDRRGTGLFISARRTDARRPPAATRAPSLPADRVADRPRPPKVSTSLPVSGGSRGGWNPAEVRSVGWDSAGSRPSRRASEGVRSECVGLARPLGRRRTPTIDPPGLRSTPTEGNTPRISALLGTSRMPGDSQRFGVGRPRTDPSSAGVAYRFERLRSSSGRFFAISPTPPTSFAGGSMRSSDVPTSATAERRSGRRFARVSHRSRTLSGSRDAPRRRGTGLSSVTRLPDPPIVTGAVRDWHPGIRRLGGGEHRHA